MSLLRRLFVPLHEIKAELTARFDEELRPEIDAVVHGIDAVLEHPHRLEELRERANLLRHAATRVQRHRAESLVHWLERRAHHQVHKALSLSIYGALAGAVALLALHGLVGDVARAGFAAAAWLGGLSALVSLSVQWYGWPEAPGTLSDPGKEADWLLGVLARRAWQVNAAIAAALASTVALAVGACAWVNGV